MKLVKSVALAVGLLFAASYPALAQTPTIEEQARLESAKATKYAFHDTRAIGAGIVILGAALGIGLLAKSSVESMARQPEVAGQINTSMITAAALIEGATFFALILIIIQGAMY